MTALRQQERDAIEKLHAAVRGKEEEEKWVSP